MHGPRRNYPSRRNIGSVWQVAIEVSMSSDTRRQRAYGKKVPSGIGAQSGVIKGRRSEVSIPHRVRGHIGLDSLREQLLVIVVIRIKEHQLLASARYRTAKLGSGVEFFVVSSGLAQLVVVPAV